MSISFLSQANKIIRIHYLLSFNFSCILSGEATSDRSLSVLFQTGYEVLQNPEAALHAQYSRFRISDG